MSKINRLLEFIEKTLILDNLVGARAEDLSFVRKGGKIFLTPDQSTWGAFFLPIKDGQEHLNNEGKKIDGFAEIYPESDKSGSPYIEYSSLSAKQATGMLGKILIDHIFSPSDGALPSLFFLTKESLEGLDETIKFVNNTRKNTAINESSHRLVYEALSNVKNKLSDPYSTTGFLALATNPAMGGANWVNLMLDDENPTNLNGRAKAFNSLKRFDMRMFEAATEGSRTMELPFQLDSREIEDLRSSEKEFNAIFSSAFRNRGAQKKIQSMSEILALNLVVGRKTAFKTRFLYLTNSPWPVSDFDNFSWNESSKNPLNQFSEASTFPSISKLFVRTPLCFFHDVEIKPGKNAIQHPSFVDTIVPRQYRHSRRLAVHDREKQNIKNTLANHSADIDFYDKELSDFYKSWGAKKQPWVASFLRGRSEEWEPAFEIFKKDGYNAFWQHVNNDFAKSTWKMGIYLATVSEVGPVRAAPLVFIDCDPTTNSILNRMQQALNQQDMQSLGISIEEYNSRDRGAAGRADYFDALVHAVLFMFCNQFSTAEAYASIACDIAARSNDKKITGREALYVMSYLVRITARDRRDFDRAKKYMLVARSKLSEDNRLMGDTQVSDIRFDLEDWSRKIVESMPPISSSGGRLPASYLNEYLHFAKKFLESTLEKIIGEEANLIPKILDKLKFNFIVLTVSIDEFGVEGVHNSDEIRALLVSHWNKNIACNRDELTISIDSLIFNRVSIIEKAYILALSSVVKEVVSDSFDVEGEIDKFFAVENEKTIKAAMTSVVDKQRLEKLEAFCRERIASLSELKA